MWRADGCGRVRLRRSVAAAALQRAAAGAVGGAERRVAGRRRRGPHLLPGARQALARLPQRLAAWPAARSATGACGSGGPREASTRLRQGPASGTAARAPRGPGGRQGDGHHGGGPAGGRGSRRRRHRQRREGVAQQALRRAALEVGLAHRAPPPCAAAGLDGLRGGGLRVRQPDYGALQGVQLQPGGLGARDSLLRLHRGRVRGGPAAPRGALPDAAAAHGRVAAPGGQRASAGGAGPRLGGPVAAPAPDGLREA
mmetsp:Transcript_96207/g.305268  ORF Transcript_96207/g.305268 Transcript_96207/m.305268 type:complete len:256 (-) Transcript_96207:1256-2023(-)